MKKRRHTPEQIVRKLREADRLLGEGQELAEVVKALEVSEATYHRWRAQYGGMKARTELRRISRRRPRWGYRGRASAAARRGVGGHIASARSGCGARRASGCRRGVASASGSGHRRSRLTTSRRLDAWTPASCSLPSLCSATISPITTVGSAATLSCRRRPGPRSAESCSRSSAHRTRRPQQVRSLLHSLHHAPHQADVPWHQHRPAGPGPQAQPGPAVQPRRVWISPASVEVELHEDNKVPRDGVAGARGPYRGVATRA